MFSERFGDYRTPVQRSVSQLPTPTGVGSLLSKYLVQIFTFLPR